MIINATKLPITIQAIELTPENVDEVKAWVSGAWDMYDNGEFVGLMIPTLESPHEASFGDFIIQGVNGEFYPCKPDIFKKTYKVVDTMKMEIVYSMGKLIDLVRTLPPTRQHSLAITNLEQAKHWLQD